MRSTRYNTRIGHAGFKISLISHGAVTLTQRRMLSISRHIDYEAVSLVPLGREEVNGTLRP